MRHITNEDIIQLGISPAQCVEWVREAFCLKYDAQLPPKISLHPQGNDFFNTMPCLLPSNYDRFGVKIVSRIAGNKPSLHSDLLLYKASTGEMLSFMDADWITQMRTGAVAALAIQTLQSSVANTYAFVGLGSTAVATMQCLLAILPADQTITCKLLRYKQQAQQFAQLFAEHTHVHFTIVDSHEELIQDSDVVVSAVTEMPTLFCENKHSMAKPGRFYPFFQTQHCTSVAFKAVYKHYAFSNLSTSRTKIVAPPTVTSSGKDVVTPMPYVAVDGTISLR
jgi:ornithine cyclodeaminase